MRRPMESRDEITYDHCTDHLSIFAWLKAGKGADASYLMRNTPRNTAMTSLALVAHDLKKDQMIAWVKAHEADLAHLTLCATGTTGGRINAETGLSVHQLASGPLGGDAQIGAMIAEGKLDALVFFIDPLSALPHDVDVKSLLRLAILYDTLLAVNERSASAMIPALLPQTDP